MRDARRGRRVNLIVYFLLRGDGVEGSREARDGFSVFLSPSRIFFAGTVYCYARRVGISALRTVASNAAAAIAAHNTLVLRSAAAANRIVMGAFPHHVAGDAPATVYTVLGASLLMVLAGGLGGLPFFFVPKGLSKRAAGLCLLYTSPSPRDRQKSRMPSSA